MRTTAWLTTRVSAGLVTSLLFLGLAGCGTSPDGDSPQEVPLGKPLEITDTRDLVLPLDAYRLTGKQRWSITAARIPLVEKCMERYGFDLDVPVPRREFTRTDNQYIVGLTDLAQAQKYGYHSPPEEEQSLPPEPKLSAQAQAVLEGSGEASHNGKKVPQGGCDGEAKRKIQQGGPFLEDTDAAGVLTLQVEKKVEQDSRVIKIYKEWAACMKKRGFDYAEPSAPGNDPNNRKGNAPSAREIEVATADVTCKRETNLVSMWATVTTAYQKQAIEKNSERLAQIKKGLENMLRNANQPGE
jgi:hypothetical protein